MPPYKVEVTNKGKINETCDGKNEWDNILLGFVPRWFNMVIVKVGD